MKKRLISAFLSMCFVLSAIQPAIAADMDIQNSIFEEYGVVLASGDRIAFVPTVCTEDSYEYSYYLNGVYVAKFIISSPDWSLTRIDIKTGDTSLIETNLDIPTEFPDEYAAKAYTMRAGSVMYNYCSQLGGSPRSDVRYESNSTTYQKQIEAEKGDDTGTILAIIVTGLLAAGFSYVSSGTEKIAEALLQWAFGVDAELVINGIFTSRATAPYTVHVTTYTVTVQTYGSNVSSHTQVYSGGERWVSCRNNSTDPSDYDIQGVTANNWASTSNINMYWEDAYGRVSNPGYRVVYG